MHQLGNQAGQTNCSRPSTSHQLPQCGHKTCSTPLPTWPPTVALRLARGKSHRRRKAITARQGQGTPPTPQPNPGGTPGCRPLTHLHSTPHCTKTPSPENDTSPIDGPGTEVSGQDPRQSK
ncbi:hypothetical protein AMECASPLE_020945 [Ameca splendens]|uniref:Uncharacterized protein n=1 Tax=Ameca splendens TaxID=208324 RepID=A0ABV0ZPA5_9TELE